VDRDVIFYIVFMSWFKRLRNGCRGYHEVLQIWEQLQF